MAIKNPKAAQLEERIFGIANSQEFEQTALEVFQFQYENNPLYKRYCALLNCDAANVNSLEKIPFLPISFFKSHAVQTTSFTPEVTFESSGTTGSVNSKHLVKAVSLYQKSFEKGFNTFYGDPVQYCILALLPSYLEKGSSSLVYMVNGLMKKGGHPKNAFYLNDYNALANELKQLEETEQRTILIGVTYALLDFASTFGFPLKHTTIIETGGMKGRRREIVRSEVHEELKAAFDVPHIHSEYGMTELLSQAYAKEEGRFFTPPWMKAFVREEDDFKTIWTETQKPISGVLNVIDLANIYSCSFVATEDIGRLHADGSFEVLGRMDASDIRGCSLLAV